MVRKNPSQQQNRRQDRRWLCLRQFRMTSERTVNHAGYDCTCANCKFNGVVLDAVIERKLLRA